jgi:flagellar motor switch protein FliG
MNRIFNVLHAIASPRFNQIVGQAGAISPHRVVNMLREVFRDEFERDINEFAHNIATLLMSLPPEQAGPILGETVTRHPGRAIFVYLKMIEAFIADNENDWNQAITVRQGANTRYAPIFVHMSPDSAAVILQAIRGNGGRETVLEQMVLSGQLSQALEIVEEIISVDPPERPLVELITEIFLQLTPPTTAALLVELDDNQLAAQVLRVLYNQNEPLANGITSQLLILNPTIGIAILDRLGVTQSSLAAFLHSDNLSIEQAAAVLIALGDDRAAEILLDNNITTIRAARILRHASLADRRSEILSHMAVAGGITNPGRTLEIVDDLVLLNGQQPGSVAGYANIFLQLDPAAVAVILGRIIEEDLDLAVSILDAMANRENNEVARSRVYANIISNMTDTDADAVLETISSREPSLFLSISTDLSSISPLPN